MHCPKEKGVTLKAIKLNDALKVSHCPECLGNWISVGDYEDWQAKQTASQAKPEALTNSIDFSPSPLDTKAGLCPECGSYLARAKIALKQPFYIERCSCCGGIWCDRGEWEVLEQLKLHTAIQQLFSSQWQMQVREAQQHENERQVVINRLGAELAQRVFELVDTLEKHDHGEFAAGYIMRRFDREKSSN